MDETTARGPGRPLGSTTVPSDLGAEIWVRVWIYRIKERIRTKKTPSVARACKAIMAETGVLSAVGGNLEALSRANLTTTSRWRQYGPDDSGKPVIEAGGPIFISHHVESAGSLHARFSAANKLAEASPRVRLNWMNLGRQMVGRPVKTPKWASPTYSMAWRVTANGSLVPRLN